MKWLHTVLSAFIYNATLLGSDIEVAKLEVEILPGPLEIVTSSVAGPHFPKQGTVIFTSSEEQKDAITFELQAIRINDLNGDNRGWTLTADPRNLILEEAAIPVGTVIGFKATNSSENVAIQNPNELVYRSAEGVMGYEVNYEVSYDIPGNAAPGTYSGQIVFSIAAN